MSHVEEANADWRAELAGDRDRLPQDADRPTRAELADEAPGIAQVGPDPWGDVGPVHHPTRFDLPIPDEPPF